MKHKRIHNECKRDRQNENALQLTSSSNQKTSGREQAVELPISQHVNCNLLAAINDYSLTASYARWQMGITCQMFFMWCVEHSIVPLPDRVYCWNGKRYVWQTPKSQNQTLFRTMIKLDTHNKTALQQSNYLLLNDI